MRNTTLVYSMSSFEVGWKFETSKNFKICEHKAKFWESEMFQIKKILNYRDVSHWQLQLLYKVYVHLSSYANLWIIFDATIYRDQHLKMLAFANWFLRDGHVEWMSLLIKKFRGRLFKMPASKNWSIEMILLMHRPLLIEHF